MTSLQSDRLDGKPAQALITPPALPEGDPVPQRQPEAVEAIVARFENAIARQRAPQPVGQNCELPSREHLVGN